MYLTKFSKTIRRFAFNHHLEHIFPYKTKHITCTSCPRWMDWSWIGFLSFIAAAVFLLCFYPHGHGCTFCNCACFSLRWYALLYNRLVWTNAIICCALTLDSRVCISKCKIVDVDFVEFYSMIVINQIKLFESPSSYPKWETNNFGIRLQY